MPIPIVWKMPNIGPPIYRSGSNTHTNTHTNTHAHNLSVHRYSHKYTPQIPLSAFYHRKTQNPNTSSVPFYFRPNDFSSEGFNDWAFMTTHSWDEDPQGEWTLEIENVAANGRDYGKPTHHH